MDEFSKDTVIAEDQIVFEFGDGSFEPSPFEYQNHLPAVFQETVGSHSRSTQLENFNGLDIDLESIRSESHASLIEPQNSIRIEGVPFSNVEQSESDLISPKVCVESQSFVDSNSAVIGNVFNSEGSELGLNGESHDNSYEFNKIFSDGVDNQLFSSHALDHDSKQDSTQSTALPVIQNQPLSTIDDSNGSFSFLRSDIQPDITISTQPSDDHPFSDGFDPTVPSFTAFESNQDSSLTFPVSSSQVTIDISFTHEQKEENLPGAETLSMTDDSFLPHLNSQLDDDDEFDFDELVASRTQQKSVSQQEATPHQVTVSVPSEITVSQDQGDTERTWGPTADQGDALKQAVDEWNNVETIEADVDFVPSAPKTQSEIEPIYLEEALSKMEKVGITRQYGGSIKTSVTRSRFASLIHQFCGGPKIHQRLSEERDFVFCLGACPFNNEEDVHLRVLFSIYQQLTGSRFSCPRFGSHWELIGFQGHDPATDLRGAGVLSLLQLLHLVSGHKTEALAKSIYHLSLHETQNFPFCVMGINLTRITMMVMREDHLNKECNRRGQVLEVMNDFYVGLYHRLYTVWKTQHKTIRDTGFVLADLEAFAKKHPFHLLRMQLNAESTNQASHQYKPSEGIAHIDTNVF